MESNKHAISLTSDSYNCSRLLAGSNFNITEADPHCVFVFVSNNKTPKPQTPPPPPPKSLKIS